LIRSVSHVCPKIRMGATSSPRWNFWNRGFISLTTSPLMSADIRGSSFRKQGETLYLLYIPFNLLHRSTLRQFIDQLIQLSYLAHNLIFDLLHTHTTDHTGDKLARGVELWGLFEECLKVHPLLNLRVQLTLGVSCEP